MPSPNESEQQTKFISRCMSDEEAKKSFPDQKQRAAFCHSQWKSKSSTINETDEAYQQMVADEKAGYPPNCNEGYVEKDGKCMPLKKEEASFRYEHPKTGEVYTYRRKGVYKKGGVFLIYKGKAKEE